MAQERGAACRNFTSHHPKARWGGLKGWEVGVIPVAKSHRGESLRITCHPLPTTPILPTSNGNGGGREQTRDRTKCTLLSCFYYTANLMV